MRYDKQNKKMAALEEQIEALKIENKKSAEYAAKIQSALDTTLHEVRRFSAQLSKFVEKVCRETDKYPAINQAALSAQYIAGMISSRLAYTDIELNPQALMSQTVIRSGIYKKFDKASRILQEEARGRRVTIELRGESRVEIDALPIFELLPFVILENAIKYSPQGQTIEVNFETLNKRQRVTVTSVGPHVFADEAPYIFEKGFRGVNAQKQQPGQGLGLYLAKRVCEYHDIEIGYLSGRINMYGSQGIDQSEFKLILDF